LGTEDSVDGIFKTIKDCASISKVAGGIGIHISNIRSKDSYVRGTGGKSDGLIPMLKVYNHTARYINQGNRRNGSFATYTEPWHADIFSFLDAKKNHGNEEERARDLFYALWIPDLFMERVISNGMWSLMCPDICPGLTDVYGGEFDELYTSYENEGRYKEQIPARELWDEIITAQIETGMPYMCYKDSVNRKSNQKNIGIVKSSNLCAEVTLYSDSKEYACCNLISIRLPSYIIPNKNILSLKSSEIKMYGKKNCEFCLMAKALLKEHNVDFDYVSVDDPDLCGMFYDKYNVKSVPQIFVDKNNIGGFEKLLDLVRPSIDYEKIVEVVHTGVDNLNRIIDINYYPVPETKISNMKHRPIGIGVQGLADVFSSMWTNFDSDLARDLNKKIFECIYYAAVQKSMLIAKERTLQFQTGDLVNTTSEIINEKFPGAYSTFEGSPLQQGQFQFDLWGKPPIETEIWENLRKDVQKYGVRNSMLLAIMPTASTAQILGSNEACEPFTSNMYVRRTLAGEFIVINRYLMKILYDMGMWDEKMKHRIMYNRGSIQNIKTIPKFIREMFKTSTELPQKSLIDMSADRGIYVCQSQSLNLFTSNPTPEQITKMHFYGYKKGLKTGQYYLRSSSAMHAQSFTIEPGLENEFKKELLDQDQGQDCEACGS
jgi:ribonucleoside-diphosphate reductase subunit M1